MIFACFMEFSRSVMGTVSLGKRDDWRNIRAMSEGKRAII